MTSNLSTRIRLRSSALLEPYAKARSELLERRPGEPVVPEPSTTQRDLEAAIFGHLRYLYESDRAGVDFQTRILPTRVHAGENHLTLTADPFGLAEKLSFGILPEWHEDDEHVASGIPGLRLSSTNDQRGVVFSFPNVVGKVSFLGVTVAELQEERENRLRATGWQSVVPGSALTVQEARTPRVHRRDIDAASVVARRLGLFIAAKPIAIDSWWTRPGRFSVELIVDEVAPDPMPALLERLISREFSPRLTQLTSYKPGGYSVQLQVDGTQSELDVRIMPISRSRRERLASLLNDGTRT